MPDDLHIPPIQGRHIEYATYRPQQGGDRLTRSLLLAAAALGGVLALGMGGWALLGRHPAAVPVIEADTRPLRVRPENAGGMQVAGADEQVMGGQASGAQTMAPAAEAPAPQALRAQMQPAALPGAVPDAVQAPTAPPPAATSATASSPLDTPRPTARAAAGATPPSRPAAPAPATPTAAAPGASSATVASQPAPAASVTGGGTMVQVAAMKTEGEAQAEWQRLSKRMPDALSGRNAVVQRAERDGKQVWRVRTGGFADVAEATAFCVRLRAKGANCTIAAF